MLLKSVTCNYLVINDLWIFYSFISKFNNKLSWLGVLILIPCSSVSFTEYKFYQAHVHVCSCFRRRMVQSSSEGKSWASLSIQSLWSFRLFDPVAWELDHSFASFSVARYTLYVLRIQTKPSIFFVFNVTLKTIFSLTSH